MALQAAQSMKQVAGQVLALLARVRSLAANARRLEHETAEALRALQECQAAMRAAEQAGDKITFAKCRQELGLLKLRHARHRMELTHGLNRLTAARTEYAQLQKTFNQLESARPQGPENGEHSNG